MTECNHEAFSFSNCRKRQVKGNFFGEPISSNGGSLLVREVDRRMGLTMAVARALGDRRQRGKVRHDVATMVRQRVHAIALGYEDLNDHDALRDDLVVQTACEREGSLASSSTLCRFEQRAERQWAIAIHRELVEQFIASFAHRPRELVLDFDATDDPVHGHQPGRFFHGYYDRYCYLPLYVFCGQQLLVAYLRPSNIDASKHAWPILSLLVKLKLIRFGGHPDTVARRCPMARTKLAYAPEYRRQIVELVRTGRTAKELAREFECSASTIRNWVRQADRDEGRREDGLTSLELEELRRLRREVRQLREEREILAKATAWFARETGSVRAKSSSS